MKAIALPFKDTLYTTGLLVLGLSLIIFCLPFFTPVKADTFGLFAINLIATGLYFVLILFAGSLK